jgi:thioredoxin 1
VNVTHRHIKQLQKNILLIGCLLLLILCLTANAVFAQKAVPRQKDAPNPGTTASAPQSLPLLVDVGADKCIPCVKMAPILEDLKKEYEGILEVKFVDVWKKPEEAKKYQIMGIPTQIFYDASGKELGRHMGFIDKEGILEGFKHFGITIKDPDKKK